MSVDELKQALAEAKSEQENMQRAWYDSMNKIDELELQLKSYKASFNREHLIEHIDSFVGREWRDCNELFQETFRRLDYENVVIDMTGEEEDQFKSILQAICGSPYNTVEGYEKLPSLAVEYISKLASRVEEWRDDRR